MAEFKIVGERKLSNCTLRWGAVNSGKTYKDAAGNPTATPITIFQVVWGAASPWPGEITQGIVALKAIPVLASSTDLYCGEIQSGERSAVFLYEKKLNLTQQRQIQ